MQNTNRRGKICWRASGPFRSCPSARPKLSFEYQARNVDSPEAFSLNHGFPPLPKQDEMRPRIRVPNANVNFRHLEQTVWIERTTINRLWTRSFLSERSLFTEEISFPRSDSAFGILVLILPPGKQLRIIETRNGDIRSRKT